MDLQSTMNNLYSSFAGEVVTEIGTDSKELLKAGAIMLSDSKSEFFAIGLAVLNKENPMSYAEAKLKLIQVGKNIVASFETIEQIIASDIQSLVTKIIAIFENLLTGQLQKMAIA